MPHQRVTIDRCGRWHDARTGRFIRKPKGHKMRRTEQLRGLSGDVPHGERAVGGAVGVRRTLSDPVAIVVPPRKRKRRRGLLARLFG